MPGIMEVILMLTEESIEMDRKSELSKEPKAPDIK